MVCRLGSSRIMDHLNQVCSLYFPNDVSLIMYRFTGRRTSSYVGGHLDRPGRRLCLPLILSLGHLPWSVQRAYERQTRFLTNRQRASTVGYQTRISSTPSSASRVTRAEYPSCCMIILKSTSISQHGYLSLSRTTHTCRHTPNWPEISSDMSDIKLSVVLAEFMDCSTRQCTFSYERFSI